MKTSHKIILMILLISTITLSITSYKLYMKEPETHVMCNMGGMVAVRVKPSGDAQISYVLSSYDKIWWSGPRTERWIYIDYAHGSGWIEATAELGDCPPEIEPPSIFKSFPVGG